MDRETLSFQSEAEWLALRRKDVTSTETAALFECSPYATPWELWHQKAGNLTPQFNENERMVWGRRLEAAIADGIAEDLGLIVEPFKTYMRIPEIRMGSSFDFKITGVRDDFSGDDYYRDIYRTHGPGILEVKNVDGAAFRRGWSDDEELEAPPHIEMQVQHQMEVSDLGWAILAPLVGGNTPRPVLRWRQRHIGEAIRQKVAAFFQSVDAGEEPEPNFEQDAEAIARHYVDNDGSAIDLSDNDRLAELCAIYDEQKNIEKEAEKKKKAAKAEILTIIEKAKTVQADGYRISAGTNKETFKSYRRKEGVRWQITKSVIPEKDIEATVPPYRNVRVSPA